MVTRLVKEDPISIQDIVLCYIYIYFMFFIMMYAVCKTYSTVFV